MDGDSLMQPASTPRTLFDKLWQSHVVSETPDGPTLLYVDRQLVYEVTSPQAFESMRLSGRIREYERVRRAREPWLFS
jgi:3-isopropylmalate/(R)-2-methylmalate dehydratase large subunit